MSCGRLEPPPEEYFVPEDVVQSPGGNFYWRILSYPVCRLFYAPGEKFEFQPHSFEWHKGAKTNYVSYLAVFLDGDTKCCPVSCYITDRHLHGSRTRGRTPDTAVSV